jgi:tetratricopeptide (TPR) repeat protein
MAEYRAGLALVANVHGGPRDLGTVQALWAGVGQLHIDANRIDEAVNASAQALAAAEAAYAQAPGDLNVSRNLSLALKINGGLAQRRGLADAALAQFYKARDLDLARTQRQPERSLWKLDLSFSYGSIATALAAKDQPLEAMETYREAMRLREQAARIDPADDFIASALARGYGRMAEFLAGTSGVDSVLESLESQLRVLRQRVDAHPDRSNLWLEYGTGAFSAARLGITVLESHPGYSRRAAARVEAMIEELGARRAQWALTHTGSLAEDDAALAALTTRAQALMSAAGQ